MLTAMQLRQLGGLVLLNLALAGLIQAAAPGQPLRSDRGEYEYTCQHGLEANCPNSIYCYRLLVPVLLEQIPIDAELRWRGYQVVGNAAAGSILAIAVSELAPGAGPLVASIMAQFSYGFAFTAYDPYTADPMVFLIAALFLLCWIKNAPFAALVLVVIGVFAKETVALVAAAGALAALADRDRPHRVAWISQAVAAWIVLIAFHLYMDTFAGWNVSQNAAAQLSSGSWLAIWWRNNPFLGRKLLMLFAPFGFAWLYAMDGWRLANRDVKYLALGAVLPMCALVYVQTPERALGNAFFVVIPLAALFLSRLTFGAALAAVVANGLLTARLGSSSPWAPSSGLLLALATATALICARERWYAADRRA